ncbi:MAG: ABC transporter permease, partial [Rubricoccaceae bacterium]|nr:ABC transporter permease [Rubricoccaceae bacterium]
MQKILLIARSEYLRRVRTKTFVLTTLLAPLLMFAAIGLPVLMAIVSESDAQRTVAIIDRTGRLALPLSDELPSTFSVVSRDEPVDTLRAMVLDGRLDGYFVLEMGLLDGSGGATYFGRGGGGLTQQMALQGAVRSAVQRQRIRETGAGEEVLTLLDERAQLDLITISEEGDAADGAVVSTILGYVLGMLIYVAVLIYGVMVMRGVIEEKSTRIVEVIASSARPVELMMGKVFGIGAVGLTQLVGWSILMVGVSALIGPLLALLVSPEIASTPGINVPETMQGDELPFDPMALSAFLTPTLMITFVGFFLGGYLLFSALFAAVGSAVEQESDAQTLQLPVMLPIILPVFFFPYVL